MDRVYCDTCLFLDIFQGRKDKYRDLGQFALQIFRRAREGEFILIISDWLLKELKDNASGDDIAELLEPIF